MADLLCPRCGKPSRGVCAECYVRDNQFSVKPETYRECECGLRFFKGRFYGPGEWEALLRDVAAKSVKPPESIKFDVLDVEAEQLCGEVVLEAKVRGTYLGGSFIRDLSWKIRPEKMRCDACRKIGSGYYEAILQVRGDYIDVDLDDGKVSSVEKTRGGFDYYIVDVDYAQEKVRELINRGFLVKQSSKLFGKKNGRDVFRFYYSIKRPHFSIGDFLRYDGVLYRVIEVAKTVKLKRLPSGRCTSASMHRLESAEVLAKSSSAAKAIVTEVRPDGMQIMDSIGCETYEVPAADGVRRGDEVEYVRIDGKTYVL